jgi:hypothetical protein
MSAELPADKDALMARIRQSRAALEAQIAPLAAEQLAAPGPDGGWSIKDHLYHLATWQQVQLARMQGRPEWSVVEIDEATYRGAINSAEDFRDINAIIWQRGNDLSADDVLALFRDTFAQLLAELDRWSYADLLAPVRPDGPSVLKQLSGDSYEHDDEHLGMIAD